MLTDLEMKLMNKIWAVRGEVTVSDIHYEMLAERRIAYTTVKTVMDRLVNKKILSRRKDQQGTYHYKALVDAKTVADYWKKYIQENIAGGTLKKKA